MENSRIRIARQRLQSRPQESQRRHRLRASSARTARRRYSQERAAHCGDHGRDQRTADQSRRMSTKWPRVKLGEVLSQYTEYIDAPEAREYPKLSVKLYGRGVVLDTPANGAT